MTAAATKPARLVNVFLHLEPKLYGRWQAQWVARRTGSVMYASSLRDTRDEAVALARKALAKRPHLVDTTTSKLGGAT